MWYVDNTVEDVKVMRKSDRTRNKKKQNNNVTEKVRWSNLQSKQAEKRNRTEWRRGLKKTLKFTFCIINDIKWSAQYWEGQGKRSVPVLDKFAI